MQQDPTTNALTYIHYDQQPYKEVDIYQAYHNKYTTENDPLHTSEQDDDEESLPSILEPGENEDTGLSDDEESLPNDIPILLERDDESDSDNEDELEWNYQAQLMDSCSGFIFGQQEKTKYWIAHEK